MTDKLSQKLESLPNLPGVYYHLDSQGEIIYVGKAANLKSRVRQYFHKSTPKLSLKDYQLRAQIADVNWRLTDNGFEALYLESEMIKRYQPKYNVLNRNSTSSGWLYLGFHFNPNNPHLVVSRSATLEDYNYLGPYIDGRSLKKLLKYLRKIFPYSSHKTLPKSACLDYHLGLCSGPETDDFQPELAVTNLKHLKTTLEGKQRQLITQLTKQMSQHSDNLEFEQAASLRNQIEALRNFKQSLIFASFSGHLAVSDQALIDLAELLNLDSSLERIETYDISHTSGSYTTASMIVASSGIVLPALSRRFKSTISSNNDYAQIKDIITRRFKTMRLKSIKPDLIIIDGGKAQVSAVSQALAELKLNIPVIGLAKKQEQIIFSSQSFKLNQIKLKTLKGNSTTSANFTTLNISSNSHVIKLLQRLRDASHKKAVGYHSQLRTKAQLDSQLLNLPSVGQVTYKKLIKQFGSVSNIKQATDQQLAEVLNKKQLKVIRSYLNNL